jgi:hypothetical protein
MATSIKISQSTPATKKGEQAATTTGKPPLASDRGVDEVLVPGQLGSLRRRIELLLPTQQHLTTELAKWTAEAKNEDRTVSERATRHANRIRTDLKAVDREVETLQSLIEARLAQVRR